MLRVHVQQGQTACEYKPNKYRERRHDTGRVHREGCVNKKSATNAEDESVTKKSSELPRQKHEKQ